MDERIFDTLATLAREAEPQALTDATHQRMVEEAMRESATSSPTPSLMRSPAISATRSVPVFAWAAVTLLAALGGASLAYAPWTGAPLITKAPALLRSTLPTGDVLTALAGSEFNIASADAERRIEVLEGSVLFDVLTLGQGESFEVTTPESRVRVRGTVFSVERHDGRTTVHVHEGLVEVEPLLRDLPTLHLGAGTTWQSGSGDVTLPSGTTRLFDAGLAAAQRRAAVSPEFSPESPAPSLPASLPASSAPPSAASEPEPTARLRPPQVRRWIHEGHYERARAAAHIHEWHRLEGDALRALGRFEAAAECYDQAHDSSAAYDAAALRFHRLGRAEDALRTLQRMRPGSDVAERALALKVRLLMHLSRPQEAAESAESYRQLYPSGDGVRWLEAVQREVSEPTQR